MYNIIYFFSIKNIIVINNIMDTKIRIKTPANIIKERVRNNDEVISYVNQILDTIQNAIEDSIEMEQSFCTVRVCSNFFISFLTQAHAIRDIYFLAHQSLVQAGYIVNIKYIGNSIYTSDCVFFKIKWETDYDTDVNNSKIEYLERVSEKIEPKPKPKPKQNKRTKK